MNVQQRQAMEREIAARVIDALLASGKMITVNDGQYGSGENVLHSSRDKQAILAAMFSTDDDTLYVADRPSDTTFTGYVVFVYGNDGWDVMADYTVNLEEILKPAIEYIDSIAP